MSDNVIVGWLGKGGPATPSELWERFGRKGCSVEFLSVRLVNLLRSPHYQVGFDGYRFYVKGN